MSSSNRHWNHGSFVRQILWTCYHFRDSGSFDFLANVYLHSSCLVTDISYDFPLITFSFHVATSIGNGIGVTGKIYSTYCLRFRMLRFEYKSYGSCKVADDFECIAS